MKKIKKVFLALILLFALSSVSLAFQGYVAADYDVKEQNFTTTLHLQKRSFVGSYMGVTAKTLPGLIQTDQLRPVGRTFWVIGV